MFYTYLSWQCSQGFNSSARTPHEQKMGGIIGGWRAVPQTLAIMLLGLASIVVLRLPEHAAQAAIIKDSLKQIPNETIQGQMMLPIAMAHVLPIGIKGLFGTIMLFISFTCHDTYMHSWGSIFIQDVYLPIRNKVCTPQEHIKLLRYAIIGVAVFAYVFSLLYPPDMPILMFFATTGTIWLGGSGAVIVGGLYWKRGNTAAAFCALNSGGILGVIGVWLPRIWKSKYGVEFPVNGQWLWLIAMILSLIIYISVSVITGKGKKLFDLDRILHRGIYAKDVAPINDEYKGNKWLKVVGITREFSKGDRFLAICLVVWNALNLIWFVAFSIINLFYPITDRGWASYWYATIIIYVVLSIPCAVWFTFGGVLDIRALLKHLDTAVRDEKDDGRVTSHHHEESNELLNENQTDSVLTAKAHSKADISEI